MATYGFSSIKIMVLIQRDNFVKQKKIIFEMFFSVLDFVFACKVNTF